MRTTGTITSLSGLTQFALAVLPTMPEFRHPVGPGPILTHLPLTKSKPEDIERFGSVTLVYNNGLKLTLASNHQVSTKRGIRRVNKMRVGDEMFCSWEVKGCTKSDNLTVVEIES